MNPEMPQNRKLSEKYGGRRFMTLVAACGLVVIACWNGARVMGDNGTRDRASKAQQQALTKFHTQRDAISRKERSRKDPVLAFFERAKRGMTEAEIRGMVAEYEALSQMPNWQNLEESRDYMEKKNDWYTAALTEALSLTSEQKQKVRVLLSKELNQILESLNEAAVPEEVKEYIGFMGTVRQRRLDPGLYYGDSKMAPWNLCDLTEDQVKLTYKQFLKMRDDKSNINISPLSLEHPLLGYRSLAMHDPATGEYIGYPTPSIMELRCSIYGSVSGGIINVSNTFPLTPDQKLENHRNDLLAQAKLLHPAQLRMALLMNPGVLQTIKYELDKPSGQ